MKTFIFPLIGLLCVSFGTVQAETSNSVAILSPLDKELVTSPVKVTMMVHGMSVHPAGEIVAGTGHHHILVDKGCVPEGEVVGTGEGIYHFGKGQTEADIPLASGPHTITIQFANGAHQSYGPHLCATVHVTAK